MCPLDERRPHSSSTPTITTTQPCSTRLSKASNAVRNKITVNLSGRHLEQINLCPERCKLADQLSDRNLESYDRGCRECGKEITAARNPQNGRYNFLEGLGRLTLLTLAFALLLPGGHAIATDAPSSGDRSAAGTCRSHPLGLLSGEIKDWQLAASSVVSRALDKNCAVKYARLHSAGNRAWCPENPNAGEWLLVDLGVQSEVSGLMTQGRDELRHWVTHYHVSYSEDAYRWEFARDIYGNKKVFRGNSDSHTVKVSYLEHPVKARFIRLHVEAWHGHPSLRLEILGCQECNQLISSLPTTIMESSTRMRRRRAPHLCNPEDGHIHSSGGWCPKRSNEDQWLQLDLGPPTLITGIITRGRGDRKHWVQSYTISYSNDTNLWFHYKDANHLEAKVFGGNMDIKTERRHYLNVPMVARYVRVHPQTWRRRIGLRVGIIGCPHSGDCGPGFLSVNALSPCVNNKAFSKNTWTNDKRHTWKQWKYGHSSLAVDGRENNNLPNCAIMDNYYVEKPVWMVDLGRKDTVSGVVILTWQGAGQDRITPYSDYVHNLDRLTVYVSNNPELDAVGLANERKCGVITRTNTALFNPRLHFDCPEPLKGQYVYVKATGVANRWKKHFTVVLCEVMVY